MQEQSLRNPNSLFLMNQLTVWTQKELKNLGMFFKRLSEENGTTLLISSHILGEIEKILHTIGIIKEGKLIEEISMEDLRSKSTMYLELKLSDCKKAAYLLHHKLGIQNYKIIEDQLLRIYDEDFSQSLVTKTLLSNGIEIEAMNKKFLSLEDYFLTVTEGGIINA